MLLQMLSKYSGKDLVSEKRGYTFATVNLKTMSLPDLQPAFLKRTELTIAALAGNGSAGEAGSIKIEK